MSRRRSCLNMHRRAYTCNNTVSSREEEPAVPQIVSDDLLIHFEANDPASYPGSGLTSSHMEQSSI